MFPFPRRKPLEVIVFSEIFSIVKGRLLRTKEISDVLRALADFRVTKLTVIEERGDDRVRKELSSIFTYAFTPPYLKKYIKMMPLLSKVGVLSPIDVSYHRVPDFPVEGDVRLSENGDLGIKGCRGNRGYVMIVDSANCRSINYIPLFYSGPELNFETLDQVRRRENLIVASRSGGDPYVEKAKILDMYERKGLALLIGPPSEGVIKHFPGVPSLNFLPKQGTANVRSKEALISALLVLNYILS